MIKIDGKRKRTRRECKIVRKEDGKEREENIMETC